jgi:cytochrome c oxidase subunit 2
MTYLISPIFPTPVSPNGWDIYHLYEIISIPAAVVFVVVEALLVITVIRFRRSRQPRGYVPPEIHGHLPLEITWTVIPFLILVFIGVLSFRILQKDFLVSAGTIAPSQGGSYMTLTVVAHQYGWDYRYPQGFTVDQEGSATGNVVPLVVPVGELVRMRITSRDVIHSWWVPALTGKTDAVPGYYNFTWFKISHPGEWRGECAELCGSGHYTMQIRVKAVPMARFKQWVAQQLAAQKHSVATA